MRQSKLILFIIYSIWAGLISSSCEQPREHPIPDVYVSFAIDLHNDPEFFRLNTQGATAVITSSTLGALNVGYLNNGIIIYNGGGGEFLAYDRTCPHDLPESVSVIATCPVCGSEYVFTSMGAPSYDSPSNWALKTYQAVFNPNTGILMVSN